MNGQILGLARGFDTRRRYTWSCRSAAASLCILQQTRTPALTRILVMAGTARSSALATGDISPLLCFASVRMLMAICMGGVPGWTCRRRRLHGSPKLCWGLWIILPLSSCFGACCVPPLPRGLAGKVRGRTTTALCWGVSSDSPGITRLLLKGFIWSCGRCSRLWRSIWQELEFSERTSRDTPLTAPRCWTTWRSLRPAPRT
mmetsp:Transcript_102667/g.244733  ORF Transcript_102667/g.244733 Transcript_102667/m.244733 type:complete len:202 (+) Transcript_102667:361-966(+)